MAEFVDQVDVLPTLARPKKFNVIATDGHSYRFLCKPSDDLRKDARLMDLHTLINQIFKGNAEARRRQLREHLSKDGSTLLIATFQRRTHIRYSASQ